MLSEPLNAARHNRIASTLQGILGRVLRIEPRDIDVEAPFLELGADSLALVEALRGLQDAYGVRMTIRQLFEQFPTISALATFLDQTLPAETASPAPPPPPQPVQASIPPPPPPPPPIPQAPLPVLPAGAASGMERVFGLQIQAFNQLVAQQLQMLGGRPQAPSPQPIPPPTPSPVPQPAAALKPVLPTYLGKAGKAPGASLTERQQRHLDALVERYCRKTAKSKELTQRYRSVLADSRATVGFRPMTKEMLYPLARAGGKGSRLWDVDGNEYIDLTMGMGVHLLGHAPDFLQETFERQVREGFEIGPRSAHSGEVAALFCELTGMERATFTNSGTEACMTAIRLARARTGRTKIVMFAGSYHGHSDGTLAQSQEIDGELRSFPVAPGIPPRVAEEVLVLDYGTPRALEIIREHRHELAAVMVEPIQSRRPDLQPADFLHELRKLTAESGIALIFDEMICGFRLHLGGAQAHFGIRADLATYGKIVGGGLPIGVVAGSAEYMDGIDGGMWRYGDDSRPERETTFFGGTFCQHPLAMSAAREVLAYLKQQGPSLQQDLNDRTGRFVGRLNDFFTADKVPIKAVHAHSLFRFNFSANAELLYYHMVEKGVYVWEWRNNFLSTAHTDEDLGFVLNAVRESVEALREGGFLPDRPSGGPPGGGEKAQAFWGRPGIKPSIAPVASASVEAPAPRADAETRFSLYFFGNYAAEFQAGKYDLLVDCARFADREGFAALWFPERHFHAFGGFCPNPSVLASALARETERIALRAGSVVLPLHHPLRVAEEWSLVDNLSGGRIGLAYASGWHPNDFALAPESYGRHRDLTFERAEIIRRLWRGEAVRMKDGAGTEVDLRIYPLPARRDLPVWITIVNNPDTYRLAGEMGAGVLTNLMGQTIEGLAANLAVYREALAAAGHPPEAGRVTLLLHTFLGPDAEAAVATARRPFYTYLESSVGLVKNFAASEGLSADFDRLSREDFEYMLELAYQRYVKTSALIGSPETCAPIVERMRSLGVDEIACLVDFGVDAEAVRASLPWIAALKDCFRPRTAVPEPEATAPLTDSQSDLHTVAQIGVEASLAYLESGAVEMRGPLDLPAFRGALRQAAGRHEALRAVIPDADVQVFRSRLDLETPVVDVSALPPNQREEAAAFWIESAARRPFDLAQGPLIRTSILRLGPRLHRLGLFVHHIAADGLSLSLFLEEVFTIYEAERAGCRAALQPALRYRDYVAWLAAGGDEPDGIEKHEAWWLAHLAGPLPVFEPPTDRPRPALRSFRGSRRRLALDPALRDGIRGVGRRHGATLYSALLAAWSVLLHRWTGQDDLIVGGPAARRPLEGGDRLVGHCVDLVAFRSRLEGEEPPFSRYLAAMRSQVLDVQEHGSVSFARLMRLLRLPTDPGRAPLIQTVFNFDPGLGLTRAAGLELAEVSPPVPFVKFDLAVHVLESGEAPLLQLDYRTDLFDAATVDRLLERFQVLVGGIVADPETPLGDLPLLTEAERRQVLVEWSGSETAYPRETPVHRVFEEVAARQPDAPAVLWEEGSLTYGELARRAKSLARHLRSLGVVPETPVALDLERSPELITAMLAVLEAGGFYVPLDPADSSERRAWLLSDSRAKVVLTAKDLKDQSLWSLQPVQSFESSPLGGDALAYVLYTSGSTGRPKGVAVPHRAINRLILETDYVRLGPEDRSAHLSNTAFDASTLEVWGPLLTGGSLVIIPREVVLSPAALGAAFRRWKISVSFLTAALFNEVLREAPGSLGGVRNQLAGGEALSPRWVREGLAQLEPGCRLLNGYGPTECTTFAVVHDIRSAPEGRRFTNNVPIGRPIANTRAYVLDREMRPVPQGVAGELFLGGDGLARGYWHRTDLTAERFVPDPFGSGTRLYRTGDLVRWLADGTLEYLGRTDEQVKIRGFRIEPGEIESVLSRCPAVGECAVIARQEPEGKILLAFATRTGEGPDVRSWLRERLPDYMVPARVVLLESLPRTASGKIDRRALLEWAPPEEEPEAFEGPRTPVEEIVAGVWAEVLVRERVGRRESFLDLGGHSLLAGRVLGRLRSALGVELPLPDFFLEPTVEGLARRAERALGAGEVPAPPLSRVAKEGQAPLSFAQQRLWVSDRVARGSALYNMPVVLQIEGPLEIGRLAAALAEIVRRHEPLRTVFGMNGDEPVQRILPEIPGLAVIDVRSPEEADRLEREEVRRPFALETGPLFRSLLLRLGPEDHRLILHAHHIVSDDWSLGVLYRELAALYQGSRLPALPVRYADYAVWQRGWMRDEVLESQLGWWTGRLAGLHEGLDLPADRPRPAVQSYRGAIETLELPAASRDLLSLGRRHGATPFMTLAAAFLALLDRHTGQEDLAVAFPMAGRTRPEIEPLIGFFVHTLVLRVDLSGEPGFAELLGRVRESALGAWAHQDLPFERLVEALAPERDLSRSPLVQVLFSYRSDSGDVELAPGLVGREREVDTGTSKFDLSVFLRDADGDLRAEAEYATDLFDRGTAGRFLERLGVLIQGIVAAPETPIGDLPLLTGAEREQILVDWSGITRDYPSETPVHRIFEEVAARQPAAPAVISGNLVLTYGELATRAASLARRLRELGVEPGMPVALSLPRSPEMITAMLAVLAAGAFYVPLDPEDTSERRAFLLEDSGAQVLLTLKDLKDLSLQPLQSFMSWAGGGPHLAYMIYTSGSTGRPKGVAVPHRAINRLVLETDYFQTGPGDRVANLVNMTFDVSTWEVWGGLLLGAAVVVVPKELVLEPPALADWLVKMRVDVAFLPVSVFNEIARERPAAFGAIRELFSGGEALTPRWVRESLAFIAPGHRLVNGYGPTECTCWALTHDVRTLEEGRSVPIGRPIVNTTAHILDRALRPVPVGVPGELCLGGPGVAQGYWKRPDLTADKFVPDPFGEPGERLYRTGDLARWLPDGTVEYLGRTDHQVKIRGYRIEPGEIENVLARCPGVAECAIVVRSGPEGRSLAAFVSPVERAEPDARGWLRAHLPEYMVPAAIVFQEVLPKTSSGKIDRRALLAQELPAEVAAPEGPRTPVEEIVAGVWAEVLGLERVGLAESFFDLGGHSLLAGRVLARLRSAFGIDLPLRTFFADPTVRGLARRVEEARQEGVPDLPPIIRVPRDSRIPLSFAQQRLWFFDRLAPGSALYNMPVVLEIRGPLEIERLAAALAEIVRRHESLRTVFVLDGDEPVQEVLPEIPGLFVIDAEPESWMQAELRRPFSLEQGPLFRSSLLSLGPEDHLLVLHAHHIVSDGWSVEVILRELAALYGGSSLPDLPVQYADFAVWQRTWLRGEALDGQLAWWTERLAGLPEGLDLPADHPRPAVQSYRGAVETVELPPVVRDLLRLGRRHGATPFMAVAAAFLAFVQRHTGRDDLAVGFPMAGRTRAEIEPLVGFFVNTLVLRADLSGEPVFSDLLGRVRDSALGAWAHQDLPFERLVEALAPERDLSRSPLVQVLFSYRSAAWDTVLAPGVVAREGEMDTGTSKFDLSLFVREAEDGFRADVEYSTDLFERATVKRFLGRLGILIEGIAAAPETPLGDLPLLAAPERDQVLLDWSGSEPAYPRETPIHQVFEEVASRHPNAPAVLWDGGSLTYAELSTRSSALAHRLRGLGVGLETPVALDMERSPELIVAMLGVLKAGGLYVPLDPADSSGRRAWLLENSQAKLALSAKDLLSLQPLQSFMSSPSGGLSLAYILYTSGSTGRPKGVAVPHRAINRLILNTDYVHLGPGDRTAHLSNTAFDASTFEVWGALLTGAALVIFPREVVLSPAALGEAFRRWKISASFLTAALFNEVLRESPGSLGGVRNQLAGGEALSPRWVREALSQLEPGCRLLNGYGPTECTTFAVVHDIRSAPEGRSIPIGRPIANTRAYVLDPLLRPVPPGVAGELLLGGDGLARGYWGRPDLTAERFVPDPVGGGGERLYRTGDLVRWLPDGTLEYLGRTDAQVKIRGFRIEPGEIESVLSRCPGIGECAVIAQQGENGKILLAFATQAGPLPEIRTWLRERLPDYMVPSRVVLLDTLPRTSSGKIDRRALLGWELDEAPETFELPRTPVEEIVAGIWSEVLERDKVGLGESFFDLGGHSLLASRTLARLRSAFGVDLPLRAFFLDPTVEGVARQVEEARRSQIEIPPIPRASRDRRLPLSYAQERLWLVDQLQPGNTAYNSFFPLSLSGGPLSVPALEAALAEIVRRHESLRTRFVSGPEGPEQVVDPPAPWRLPVIDLSGLEDPLGERQRLVTEEAYRSFDLARGPLFRASLVRLDGTGHDLLLNFHHIVCDGWSLTEVLPVELNALYRGEILPELPIQVPDFAVWQREQLGNALDEHLAWWKEKLGGAPPVLDLPYDHPRPKAISRGTVESLTLPPALSDGLAKLGRRHGATLFMTLLAGIQTLLQRYSHEDRIAVGTAVGNRPRHETEGLIGLFLNTLVLQTDLSGDLTFRDLLERVRDVTLDAFDHQDLPFERLVAALSPGRNLFQVLFLLQNMRVAPLDLPGITAGLVEYPSERVQFELAFTAYEWEGNLILAVPYSTDLFDRPTIQRLLDNARLLLEHMVEHPERPVSEAPLLFEAERRQIVAEANEPESLETRLDKRQQQVAERLDKLSPERRSLLRKLMRKG